MLSPSSRAGDAVMWNGPSTVLSVPCSGEPLSVSTSDDTPSTSESRMNSWRVSSHIAPTSVRKPIAVSHSATVGSTSRTSFVEVHDDALEDRARDARRGWTAKLASTSSVRPVAHSRSSRSALPCAILARSASLIGAVRRNSVATSISSKG